jgi:hypothetical protein
MAYVNRWMNDPQYLAQVGHLLGGAIVVLVAAIFFGARGVEVALGVGIAAAAIKEFWFDVHYEAPKQSWGDSAMDFAFYVIGGLVGLLIAILALHLGRLHP